MNREDAKKYKVPTFKVKLVRDNRGGSHVTMSSHMAGHIIAHNIGDVLHEEVWVLPVDAQSRIIGAIKVGQGGANAVGLTVKDILTPLALSGASGFVMGHNHPSGSPKPSPEDITLTNAVERAGNILNIILLDHVIVARNTNGSIIYHSMFESGDIG